MDGQSNKGGACCASDTAVKNLSMVVKYRFIGHTRLKIEQNTVTFNALTAKFQTVGVENERRVECGSALMYCSV